MGCHARRAGGLAVRDYSDHMQAPALMAHPASALHDTGEHHERSDRIGAIEAALSARDDLGFAREHSPCVERDALLAAHSAAHVARVERACARGPGLLSADNTVVCGEPSLEAARRAAGGAARMVDRLLGEGVALGASLHRPPGHHAERDGAMGYCLFNNVAVAALRALDTHAVKRVLVLDWDVHHGNGTCDIFAEDPRVLVISIHQWPLYPGTGRVQEAGAGAGAGSTVNLPVPRGSDDAVFGSLIEHLAVPLARSFSPELMLLSAGFDAHSDDPLGGCEMTDAGFATMAGSLRRLADDLTIPVGLVLEGGYDIDALARSLVGTLEVLAGDVVAPSPHRRHDLVSRLERSGRGRWIGTTTPR